MNKYTMSYPSAFTRVRTAADYERELMDLKTEINALRECLAIAHMFKFPALVLWNRAQERDQRFRLREDIFREIIAEDSERRKKKRKVESTQGQNP